MFSFSASQPEMCFHLVKQVAVGRDWPAALTIDISIPHISLLFHSSFPSLILRARFPLPLTTSWSLYPSTSSSSSRPYAVASAFSAPPWRSVASARRRAEPSIISGASRPRCSRRRARPATATEIRRGEERRSGDFCSRLRSSGLRERLSGEGRRANGAADDNAGSLAGGNGGERRKQ